MYRRVVIAHFFFSLDVARKLTFNVFVWFTVYIEVTRFRHPSKVISIYIYSKLNENKYISVFFFFCMTIYVCEHSDASES